jgi:hypothetical protein
MIRLEQIAYTVAIHPGRMGQRWKASVASVCIPAPHTAASMVRSAWCKPSWCGLWPATISLTPGPTPTWELTGRVAGTRSRNR